MTKRKKIAEQTIAPIAALPYSRKIDTAIKPEFVRLPKAGTQEPYTGLSRFTLNEMILPTERNNFKPPVKSICLRQRGAKRGIRLIVYESLIQHLQTIGADSSRKAG